MSKKTRVIILSVLAVLIVVVLSVSITTAFMKPIDQGGNITEVSLSSCAKIKLEGTTSIKLTNSYPMSRNRGLQTTPYTFTVTSYCDSFVGFNLYLATLNTNTLAASNIHYIITKKGSKEALVEGTLTSSLDDASNFTDAEKTELNAGLSGTYGNIFKLYNNKVPYKGSATYDLYLFVDENATEYQNTTFAAGVAVKSYEREKNMAVISEACSNGQNLADCIKSTYSYDSTLYYHDNSQANGAGDNSYRYAGANPNNYVCFGSDESTCPTDNLYRIIGVFGDQVKLIKYDYANSNLLGTDGDYSTDTYSKSSYSGFYKGELTTINTYYWNYKANNTSSNTWSTSLFNKINLNTNYLNNIGTTWSNLIEDTTWKVSGNTADTDSVTPSEMYTAEITNATKTYGPSDGVSKIGLMYASDYGFAAAPSAWASNMYFYGRSSIKSVNWMYMGLDEWTMSPSDIGVFYLDYNGKPHGVYASTGLGGAYYGNGGRPVLYLKASVLYAGGTGTKDSPITLIV